MKDGLDIFDIVAELKAAAGYRGVTRVALPSEYYRMYVDYRAKGMAPVMCESRWGKTPLEVVDSGVGLHQEAVDPRENCPWKCDEGRSCLCLGGIVG